MVGRLRYSQACPSLSLSRAVLSWYVWRSAESQLLWYVPPFRLTPRVHPALCISLSTSSRTACNSSPRSSRPRSKPRCLARSTSCAAPLGRHFPHLGAGVWPGGGDRVQRADGLVKVAADRSRSRRRSARIAAPSSTALGPGGWPAAARIAAISGDAPLHPLSAGRLGT